MVAKSPSSNVFAVNGPVVESGVADGSHVKLFGVAFAP